MSAVRGGAVGGSLWLPGATVFPPDLWGGQDAPSFRVSFRRFRWWMSPQMRSTFQSSDGYYPREALGGSEIPPAAARCWPQKSSTHRVLLSSGISLGFARVFQQVLQAGHAKSLKLFFSFFFPYTTSSSCVLFLRSFSDDTDRRVDVVIGGRALGWSVG